MSACYITCDIYPTRGSPMGNPRVAHGISDGIQTLSLWAGAFSTVSRESEYSAKMLGFQ